MAVAMPIVNCYTFSISFLHLDNRMYEYTMVINQLRPKRISTEAPCLRCLRTYQGLRSTSLGLVWAVVDTSHVSAFVNAH